MRLIKYFFLLTICLLINACGASRKPKFVKSPIDNIITKYIDKNNYNVILADMDYKEDTDKYFHKYRILIEESKPFLTKEELNDTINKPTDVKIVNTDWKEVSPITFDEYKNDLGMTILSKKNGKLDKNSAPAGVNSYVGNSRYGEWRTHSNGSSFWAFYGRYRLFSDLFYGSRYGYGYGYPRNDWNDYNRNYRNKKSYYGSSNKYGTKYGSNTNTSWSKKPQTFKSRVNSKVSKSASSLKSRGYTSSKSYSKTKRSSSRYSRSSSRSRSGGFGK
ncbi:MULTISPECIES: hypothetical protein [Tenacibaculum]|uniref:hypothetical protein n=1 Tax=Tenacibaculum TaxID=104267 RepID=UPI00089BBB7F|nr:MULTISPECIES: hypothetical protein [unclassified Tenacibaculum]RBW61317.1 hypothetical protein DS884_03135 [Tenacibaculum sp. E3R01]SEE37516.1 hypothetical protein SAMN04487765_2329 [Tenacibaculum sp. MAR_2010_89]